MQKYITAFGKNDIRGIYGEDITEELYYYVGMAFVEWLKTNINQQDIWITVTHDARLHSIPLEESLIKGITATGANVLVYSIYKNAFEYFNVGKASAIAYVLFIIILVLTLIQWNLRKKLVYNEE